MHLSNVSLIDEQLVDIAFLGCVILALKKTIFRVRMCRESFIKRGKSTMFDEEEVVPAI